MDMVQVHRECIEGDCGIWIVCSLIRIETQVGDPLRKGQVHCAGGGLRASGTCVVLLLLIYVKAGGAREAEIMKKYN